MTQNSVVDLVIALGFYAFAIAVVLAPALWAIVGQLRRIAEALEQGTAKQEAEAAK